MWIKLWIICLQNCANAESIHQLNKKCVSYSLVDYFSSFSKVYEPLLYKGLSLLSEWKTQYSFSEKLRFPFTCTFVLFTISPYRIRAGANFDASLSPILKCVFYSLVIAFFIHYLYVSFTRTPSKYKGLCHFFLFYTFPALYTYIYILL